ncbi:hypothetical protein HPB49_015910 [Dermacentor silvarum]|uniref:Uncharacterized protein n=1 Tax=Dermacentor silvarum TaxID=543639 RepID=A0ACB8CA72_DERSI|nr:hypothetical protein HPB49_015910 [Dermacentor silvarum]
MWERLYLKLPCACAASPRPQSTLACALIVCGVTYLIWTTVKPSASFAAPFLFEAEEASGMMCPNENERLLTRYMDDWEVPLIRRLQNNSDEAPSRAESTSWRVLLKDKVHVFSAYLANATIWGVHVVSLVRRDMKLDNSSSTPTGAIECLIRTADGQSLRTPVLVKKMSEEFHHAFLRTHLICPLQGVAELRKPVSLTLRAVGTASTDQVQLPVQSPPATAPAKCCSVCMRPMHGRTFRLWEVIEFPMLQLVGRLQAEGWDITLVPFKLTIPYNDSNVGWGEAAMLSDCAFRSRFKTEYFVNVDFDELLVPGAKYGGNLSALIESVESRRGAGKVGSLVPRNRVFCFEHQLNHDYVRRGVLPLRSRILNAHSGVIKHNFTLKYIARARAVCSAAIHRITEFCRASEEAVYVDSNELVINHYHRCCDYGIGKEKTWGVDHRNPGHLFIDDSVKALGSNFDGLLPSIASTWLLHEAEVKKISEAEIINTEE